jgi:cytosine/uracil/thiamine/allantoin permease
MCHPEPRRRRGIAQPLSRFRVALCVYVKLRFFVALYDYAWFVGFAIAFAVYLALRFASSTNENARPATI